MQIQVNGKKETLDKEKLSIMDYIKMKGEEPESVIVEYNGEISDKEDWTEINIQENDKLEILRFMGGGQNHGK